MKDKQSTEHKKEKIVKPVVKSTVKKIEKKSSFYEPRELNKIFIMGEAMGLIGLDQEIALLRMQIRDATLQVPQDSEFILHALGVLAKLLSTQSKISHGSEEAQLIALSEVIDSISMAIWPDLTKSVKT